jgi:transaldolase
MKATQLLHNLGQNICLDNITRDLLDSGTLKRYIDDLSVTGLTSNPTIFMCCRGSLSLVSTSIACLLSFKRKEPSRS